MENYFKFDSYLSDGSAVEFRKLHNNILLMSQNQDSIKSILIASSQYNEGSSSVARSLSRIMAEESNQKVLMMDLRFDLNMSQHSNVRLPGLSDYVLEDVDLDSAIIQTDIRNLSVLLPGRAKCDLQRIINSPKYSVLMNEVKKNASYIIIDGPPVQYCAESTMIAARADRVILIVRAEKTKREVVLDTKKKLEAVHAKILGIVLNKKKHYIPQSIYKFF